LLGVANLAEARVFSNLLLVGASRQLGEPRTVKRVQTNTKSKDICFFEYFVCASMGDVRIESAGDVRFTRLRRIPSFFLIRKEIRSKRGDA
jgi:hypothetical protein